MPETDVFSKTCDIVSFIVTFMYRLTVQLAVELIKFIILLAILIVSCGLCGLGFVSLVVWAYVASEGNLVTAVGAGCLGIVMLVCAAAGVQFLVKDVLYLTDKPLLHLAKIYISSLIRKRRRPCTEDVTKQQPEAEVTSSTNVDQKAKKTV